MKIGIDFDNTIVSYDQIIYESALERSLIPKELEKTKLAVRDFLRKNNDEDKWTNLQGYIYGVKIADANPFSGVIDFIKKCKEKEFETIIVSHKTKFPFKGEKYDLHSAAKNWLIKNGIFDESKSDNLVNNIFLEETKENKLERIGSENCEFFIDDLPEFLGEDIFPKNVNKILFDPKKIHLENTFKTCNSWTEISSYIFSL